MQGTIVMLMALSGLGCHHKSCDVAFAPSCYSGACYGGGYATDYATVVEPSCYSGCYSSGYSGCYSSGSNGCYGGGYSSGSGGCYGGGYDGCYSGKRHGGLLGGLFKCFGGWGGSWKHGSGHFGRHHRAADDCCSGAADYGCYSTAYADYSPAVFGSSMPIYETPMTSGQGTAVPPTYSTPSNEAPATPAPEKPAAAAPASTKPEETSAPTPPMPTPAPGASAVPAPPVPAPPVPVPPTPAPAAVKPKL